MRVESTELPAIYPISLGAVTLSQLPLRQPQPHPRPSKPVAGPTTYKDTMSSPTEAVVEKLPSPAELKEDVAKATKKSLQSLRDFAAGGVGGVFAVVVGHPFDLVKVRMQTAEKGVYSGAMDVVRKTIAKEGMARVSFGRISRGNRKRTADQL